MHWRPSRTEIEWIVLTVADADGLLRKISTFEFMLTVSIAKSILAITKGFAEFLQQPNINLLQFTAYAESVLESLKNLRSEESYVTQL